MTSKRVATRKERLMSRPRPTLVYQLAVDDDTQAVAELEAAKLALDTARYRDDGAEAAVTDAERRLARATRAVEACYEPLTLTALSPAAFEELVSAPEHLPREGKDERWNGDVFPRAAFLACVTDDDLTPEEWATFVDENLAQGERESLFVAAIGINARWPSGAVPSV